MKFLESDLGEAKIHQLILAFVEGSEKGEATAEKLQTFVDWCEEVILNYHLIKLSAEGKMLVRSQKDDYCFHTKGNVIIPDLDK